MAIVYAAMAGRELSECAKKVKHGGWEKWVEKNCEFTRMTAWRYMELAEKLRDKLANVTHVLQTDGAFPHARVRNLVELLDRPPSELLPAEMETLLTDLREATKGETLRQLYFDFGIASLPKPTGGANHLHSFLQKAYPDHPEYLKMTLRELPKAVKTAWEKHLADEREKGDPNHDTDKFLADQRWTRIIRELRDECLKEKSYALLTRAKMEELHGALIDCKREISEVLKK